MKARLARIVELDSNAVLAEIVRQRGATGYVINSYITDTQRGQGRWVDVLEESIRELNESIQARVPFPARDGFVTPLIEQPFEDVMYRLNAYWRQLLGGRVRVTGVPLSEAGSSQSGEDIG